MPSRNLDKRAGVAAAFAMALMAGVALLGQGDEQSVTSAAALRLSSVSPELTGDSSIEYGTKEVPGVEDVKSIGQSLHGLVVTSSGTPQGAVVAFYDEDAQEVATFPKVSGIALADSEGSLAAWAEGGGEQLTVTVIAAEVQNGRVLDRVELPYLTRVMAVHNGTVALSDGDRSHLWVPGDKPQPVDFVPDDFYVVGLTDSRIVASNLDDTTNVYDRASGALIQTVYGMKSWDVAGTQEEMAGATADGDAVLVDLATGASRRVSPTVAAGAASFGKGRSLVVTGVNALAGGVEDDVVSVCQDGAECVSVITDGLPYLPNEALGQLVAQAQ